LHSFDLFVCVLFLFLTNEFASTKTIITFVFECCMFPYTDTTLFHLPPISKTTLLISYHQVSHYLHSIHCLKLYSSTADSLWYHSHGEFIDNKQQQQKQPTKHFSPLIFCFIPLFRHPPCVQLPPLSLDDSFSYR
jgi:hypothetical protein